MSLNLTADWIIVEQRRPLEQAVSACVGSTEQRPNGLPGTLVGLAVDYLRLGSVFGKEEWEKYCGRVPSAPPLPPNIIEILRRECPIFSRKEGKEKIEIWQKHMLVYFPTEVDGKPLNLRTFSEIAKRYFPLYENPSPFVTENYSYPYECGTEDYCKEGIAKGGWVLMTTDVLPNSRNKDWNNQPSVITGIPVNASLTYTIPRITEAAICILTHFFSTGRQLFSNTDTRCSEHVGYEGDCQIRIGLFRGEGIRICCTAARKQPSIGLAAMGRFTSS